MLPTASVPPTFSPELEAALRDVLPSTDPIDDPDFSPVDHVNRLFPTEARAAHQPCHSRRSHADRLVQLATHCLVGTRCPHRL